MCDLQTLAYEDLRDFLHIHCPLIEDFTFECVKRRKLMGAREVELIEFPLLIGLSRRVPVWIDLESLMQRDVFKETSIKKRGRIFGELVSRM